VSCLHIGKKRKLVQVNKFQELYLELEIIIKMLQALRNSLK